jgi:EmrB/QacA subfamily drug resistance transporter
MTSAKEGQGVSAATGAWVLLATILGSALTFIDGTAVNVALPVLGRDFGSSPTALQWVVEGYSLSLSALLLLGGALGDRFGRRRVFIIGNAIFGIASLACGLAPTMEFLIGARFVQGAGGALAVPGSLALIAACFHGEARGKAIGTWSGFSAITGVIGPVLGGFLAQTIGWRWVFFVNLPLVLVVLAISVVHVPESWDPDDVGTVDVLGSILAVTGLGALTYGLIRMQIADGGTLALVSIVAGLAVLIGFLVHERRTRNPMMPLDLFANRTFTGANLYTFLLYAALGGSLFYLPFDLQYVQGYSPLAAGAAILPSIAIMFVLSRWSGGLVGRIGARIPLVAGAVIAAIGFVIYGFSGVDPPYWISFFPGAVILGLGLALFVAPLTTTVLNAVPGEREGVASGINNAVSRVAGLIAIAALGIIMVGTFYRDADRRFAAAHLAPQTAQALRENRAKLWTLEVPAVAAADRPTVREALRDAYTEAFKQAMLVSASLCFFGALVAQLAIDPKPG